MKKLNSSGLFILISVLLTVLSVVVVYPITIITGVVRILILSGIVLMEAITILFEKLKKETLSRTFFSLLILVAFFAIMFLFLDRANLWTTMNSVEGMADLITSFGVYGWIAFFLLQYLQVVILPIPGVVSMSVGVLLYGPVIGSIISYLGLTLGAITAFWIGRKFGYPVVRWIVGKENLDKALNLVKGRDKIMIILIFLLPVFPDDLICFVAGLTSMSYLYFSGMTFTTRIVTVAVNTVFTVFLKSAIDTGNPLFYVILGIGGIAIIILCVVVMKYSDRMQTWMESKFVRKRDKQTMDIAYNSNDSEINNKD